MAVSEYVPDTGTPLSTSIFIFEKKNGKFRYIWKSQPLITVDAGLTSRAETVRNIRLAADTNNPAMTVETRNSVYSLSYDGENYRLDETSLTAEKSINNEDITSFFQAHPGVFRL